jgi:hypothetical protein
MNRRGFLQLFGAAAASAVVDPAEALWKPGQKLISIPKASTPLIVAANFSIEPWRVDSLKYEEWHSRYYGPVLQAMQRKLEQKTFKRVSLDHIALNMTRLRLDPNEQRNYYLFCFTYPPQS